MGEIEKARYRQMLHERQKSDNKCNSLDKYNSMIDELKSHKSEHDNVEIWYIDDKMTDNTQHHAKGGSLLTKAQKQLVRTKAKVLQNLGKADKTTDEAFHLHVLNFNKVQENVIRLQKQLKNYIMCAKGLAIASKDLGDVLADVYEPTFPDQTEMHRSISDMELMWNDYLINLEEQSAEHLIRYQQAFPDIKTRIAKRGRKIVDYDNARHNVEYLINAKKQDPPKIARAQEDLHDCKKIYELLNNSLLMDLPEMFNSRITFQSLMLQKIFNAESLFHENVAKTSSRMLEIAERLGKMEPTRPAPRLSKGDPAVIYDNRIPTPQESPRVSRIHDSDSHSGQSSTNDVMNTSLQDTSGVNLSLLDRSTAVEKSAPPEDIIGDTEYENIGQDRELSQPPLERDNTKPADGAHKTLPQPPASVQQPAQTQPKPAVELVNHRRTSDDDNKQDDEENVYQIPSNEPLTQPPSDCQFQVIVSHLYSGEDNDELSLAPGEIVYVIPCVNMDDQDDGWLYGMRQTDGKRGFFPENFTRRM